MRTISMRAAQLQARAGRFPRGEASGYHRFSPVNASRSATMSFKTLIAAWEDSPRVQRTDAEYCLHLPVEDAARVEALAEMYPGVSREQLLTDLLHAALDELQQSLPYVAGERVIREDELGDPVYEDVGLTPRFIALTRKHLARLAPRD